MDCPDEVLSLPVTGITHDEAVAYCDATGCRLPTAAEWRHFAGVATREPTRWGLYDVWGDPREWLSDGRIAGGAMGWPQPIAEPVGQQTNVGFRPVRTALSP